jgi:hypothetical protein
MEVPDGWQGLTHKQWVAAIELKVVLSENSYLTNERKVRGYVCALSGAQHKKTLRKLGLLQLLAIAEAMEWLQTMPQHTTSYMRHMGLLRGPKDNMVDVVLMQLGLIQQFMKMVRPGDTVKSRKAMIGLIAVTHRPFFLPFNKHLCDVYVWLYRCLPNRVLVLNMYSTWGMLDSLRQRYEWVYSDDTDNDGPDHGFRALLENLAGDKFGDYYKVQRALLHDVMVHMDLNGWRTHKMQNTNKTIF